jgi:hypothetical protein
MIDLITTSEAPRLGLVEGNAILVYLANRLAVNMVDLLVLIKALFVAGMTLLTFAGMHSRDRSLRKVVYVSVAFLLVFFLAVSINNIFLTRL